MILDNAEIVANVAAHRHTVLEVANAQLQREWLRLHDALRDISELVENEADVDLGQPNLAMQIMVVAHAALGRNW